MPEHDGEDVNLTMDQAETTTPRFTEMSARRLGPIRRLLARRPFVADLALICCFAGWSLLMGLGADSMYVLHAHLGAERVLQMQVAAAALTVGGSLTLAWRRHRPVAASVSMIVLSVLALALTGATAGFELGLAIALHAVAGSRRARTAWIVCAGGTLAVLLAAWLLPLPAVVAAIVSGAPVAEIRAAGASARGAELISSAVLYQSVVPVLVASLIAVAVGTSARNRQLHLARFVDAANALARDQEQRALLAQAAERARISREMHDVVAHSITVMVALGGGASAAMERTPQQAKVALNELVATGQHALGDIRRVLGILNDGADLNGGRTGEEFEDHEEHGSTVADLPALIRRFTAAGLPVSVTGLDHGEPERLDSSQQLAVYRIIQESLTNVLRHAPGAETVRVTAVWSATTLEVTVEDEGGPGPRADPGTGRGLVGMRDRASALGGEVQAGPTSRGWRVQASLPRREAS